MAKAAQFVRTSAQWAEANDSVSLSITGALTMECRVLLSTIPASLDDYVLIQKHLTGGSVPPYRLYITGLGSGNCRIVAHVMQTSTGTVQSQSVSNDVTLLTNTYYHIAATFNPVTGAIKIYLDGVEQSLQSTLANATSIWDSTGKLLVGAGGALTIDEWHNGLISNIRIWNTVRTAAQIANFKCETIKADNGLVASYSLNNVYTDSSGNVNTLVPLGGSNAPTFVDTIDVCVLPPIGVQFNSGREGQLTIAPARGTNYNGVIDATNLTARRVAALQDASGTLAYLGDLPSAPYPLSDGGTGVSLSDPGSNQLWGWDDTDGQIKFIIMGTGLSYNHATHTLSAVGVPGSPDTSVQYNNSGAFAGSVKFLFDVTTATIYLGSAGGQGIVSGVDSTSGNVAGGDLTVLGGVGHGFGKGGSAFLNGNTGGATGPGGDVAIVGGPAGGGNNDGGDAYMSAGGKSGSGNDGRVFFYDINQSFKQIFSMLALTADRILTFQDVAGSPAMQTGHARATAQTAANTNVLTVTVGSADVTLQVLANILVTASTLHSFGVTVDYTDEGGTSRTLTIPFSQLAGTLITAITNGTGAGPYEGVPLTIRAKSGTTVVFKTAGTFTTVTYNADVSVIQIA